MLSQVDNSVTPSEKYDRNRIQNLGKPETAGEVHELAKAAEVHYVELRRRRKA
jgi:hypothetical protein